MVSFPYIDYNYWINKNPFFSDKPPISKTIEIGLNHSRRAKPDLVGAALDKKPIQTNSDLVNLIAENIESVNAEPDNKNLLLLIFDLIQAWGGQTGRQPYVRPREAPERNDRLYQDKLLNNYRSAIRNINQKNFKSALDNLTDIKYIGESFATKHIFFWSKFGPHKEALPIYDTRLKVLLFQSLSSAPSYDIYVEALKNKSKELALEAEDLERALFAFSQNFFSNEKLVIKRNVEFRKDESVAMRLQDLYLSLHRKKNNTNVAQVTQVTI